ncbi:transposase [Cellulomonas sp. zg-ZUI222]|uniref:Transposase n=1 Tax=Cellulomonas wangleii TaxID=2816956 RepID=A0ABX8D0U3_9CELL|nr:transposase [Cellulomonas sp. zg-ZUI22]MBO0921081.1 transposase [Cellulomonas wangleii]MBO0925438.1 transposase [Cellulomonas wangleii]QVI61084.1 transposase [Cellulomonas wangleii]
MLSDEQWARTRRGAGGGRPRGLDTNAYRGRDVVERDFALTKQWRGLATRYDKLAMTYRAAVILAACITWSRVEPVALQLTNVEQAAQIHLPSDVGSLSAVDDDGRS